MHSPKLWTRDFLIDSATNFIIYLSYYLLIVTISVYATDHLQASTSEAGLAAGIFIIGTLFARLLTGKVIEHVGRKRTLYIGLIFFLGTTLLYFAVSSMTLLIIVRFLHGAGFGVAATATGTVVASLIPNERRGEGTSYYAMSATLAAAVGPFIGMFLNNHGNFELILVLTAVILTVSLIAVFFLRVPEAMLTQEQLAAMQDWSLYNFFESKAVPIAAISLLIGLSFSSILGFLTSYTREIKLAEAGSFFFLIYAAAILSSRPVTGRWFDKKGENFVMYPAFLLFAAGLLAFSQAEQAAAIFLAGALIGLGYGTFLSSAQAISVKISPSHRMGLATSTFFGFIDFGAGIGPFILGLVIPATGFRGLYAAMAGLVLLCMVLYYFLHGKKAKKARRMDNKAA